MPVASKPKVLILGELYTKTREYQYFSQFFECCYYDLTTKKQLISDLTTVHNDIVAIYCKYQGFGPIGGLKGEIIDSLPPSLKIVVSSTVGYDLFDVQALGARGISLCNSPGHAATPVADHALYLTLSLFRYSHIFERLVQKTGSTDYARGYLRTSLPWNKETGKPILFTETEKSHKCASPPFSFGEQIGNRLVHNPQGRTVGIAGFGAIGKEIGTRLNAIGMSVHYTKRSPLSAKQSAQLGYPTTYHESLDTMLPVCDLLVLALPLNASTTHIINKESLQRLPNGARIINIGRGQLIDTPALVAALKSGKLDGVALDVFEKEPELPKELLDRWDTILTPHIGSSTFEIAVAAENTCMQNIFNYYYNKRVDCVNARYLK